MFINNSFQNPAKHFVEIKSTMTSGNLLNLGIYCLTTGI